MTSPTIEHIGIAKVHAICARMDAIWRATASTDVGIDGQIEFLESQSYVSTGQIIGVQIKSGASYFLHQARGAILYYPSHYNREYWRRVKLPLILVLHDPERDLTIYTRIKPQLRDEGPIRVPVGAHLTEQSRDDLLACSREDTNIQSAETVLRTLKQVTLSEARGCEVSGCDFLLAMAARSAGLLDFSIARFELLLAYTMPPEYGLYFGPRTWDFALHCLLLLQHFGIAQSLAPPAINEWLGAHRIPDIICPLSRFGDHLLDHILREPASYLSSTIISRERNSDAVAAAYDLSVRTDATSFAWAYRKRQIGLDGYQQLILESLYRSLATNWLIQRLFPGTSLRLPFDDLLLRTEKDGMISEPDAERLMHLCIEDAKEFFGADIVELVATLRSKSGGEG
jgi:hypothetical protein